MDPKNVWSSSDIQDNRNCWSLAADAELLKHLQNLSEKIFSKANATLHSLNTLEKDVNQTCISVANTSNKFKALSDTQFVESKVQDESPEISFRVVQTNVPEARKNEDTTAKLKEALENGFKVLDTQYDVIPVNGSDSEEDELQECLLKARNPYLTRRLPFIIGSEEFKSNDNLGLIDSSSSDEEEEEEEEEDDDDEEEEKNSEDEGDEEKMKNMAPNAKPKPPSPKIEYSRPQPQVIRISDSDSDTDDTDTESEISFPSSHSSKKDVTWPEKSKISEKNSPAEPVQSSYSFADHLNAALKNNRSGSGGVIGPDFDSFSPPPFPDKENVNDVSSEDDSSDSSVDMFATKKSKRSSFPKPHTRNEYKTEIEKHWSHDKDVSKEFPPNAEKIIQSSRKSSIVSKSSQYSDLFDEIPEDVAPTKTSKTKFANDSNLNKKISSAINAELNAKLKMKADQPQNELPVVAEVSKKVKIFDQLDDSEDEPVDIFNAARSGAKSKTSLFDDDDNIENLFKNKSSEKRESVSTIKVEAKPIATERKDEIESKVSCMPLFKKSNLFGSDSDSEDDIFSIINSQKKNVDSRMIRNPTDESADLKVVQTGGKDETIEQRSEDVSKRDKLDLVFASSNTHEVKSKKVDDEFKISASAKPTSVDIFSAFNEPLEKNQRMSNLFNDEEDDLFGQVKSNPKLKKLSDESGSSSQTITQSSEPLEDDTKILKISSDLFESQKIKKEEQESSEKLADSDKEEADLVNSKQSNVVTVANQSTNFIGEENLFGEKSELSDVAEQTGQDKYFDIPPMPKSNDIFSKKDSHMLGFNKDDLFESDSDSDTDPDRFSFNSPVANLIAEPIPTSLHENESSRVEEPPEIITPSIDAEPRTKSSELIVESSSKPIFGEISSNSMGSVKDRVKNLVKNPPQEDCVDRSNSEKDDTSDERDGNLFAKTTKIPGKLAFNRGSSINVNALLPGTNWSSKIKRKPSVEAEPSTPPCEPSNLLNSVTKERVKVSTKRRPPSRQVRKARIADCDVFSNNVNASTVVDQPLEAQVNISKESNSNGQNRGFDVENFPSKDETPSQFRCKDEESDPDLGIGPVQPKLLELTKSRTKIPQKRIHSIEPVKHPALHEINKYATDEHTKDGIVGEFRQEEQRDIFKPTSKDIFADIFGDDDDDVDEKTTNSSKTAEIKNVDIFSGDKSNKGVAEKLSENAVTTTKKENLFVRENTEVIPNDAVSVDTIEAEKNVIMSSSEEPAKTTANYKESESDRKKISSSYKNLFDAEEEYDNDEDDLFGNVKVTNFGRKSNLAEVKKNFNSSEPGVDLFGDDISERGNSLKTGFGILSENEVKKSMKSVFDNEKVEEPLESLVPTSVQKPFKVESVEELKVSENHHCNDEFAKSRETLDKKSSLFDDDRFSKSVKSQLLKKSLFDDDNGGKFEVVKEKTNFNISKSIRMDGEEQKPVTNKTKVSNNISIFGEDDDDDDDLFASAKKTLLTNKSTKKSALFGDDDDDLFVSKASRSVGDKSADSLFSKTKINQENSSRIVKLPSKTVEKDPLTGL